MYVKNSSTKILGFDTERLLPGDCREVNANSPVIKAWLKNGYLEEVVEAKEEVKTPSVAEEKAVEQISKPTDDEIKAATKKADLMALAAKYGIVTDASMTIAQIKAKLV